MQRDTTRRRLAVSTRVTETNLGNLLVTEQGSLAVTHSGRISIVDLDGNRRTLIDGLPSARSDERGVSGLVSSCAATPAVS